MSAVVIACYELSVAAIVVITAAFVIALGIGAMNRLGDYLEQRCVARTERQTWGGRR